MERPVENPHHPTQINFVYDLSTVEVAPSVWAELWLSPVDRFGPTIDLAVLEPGLSVPVNATPLQDIYREFPAESGTGSAVAEAVRQHLRF